MSLSMVVLVARAQFYAPGVKSTTVAKDPGDDTVVVATVVSFSLILPPVALPLRVSSFRENHQRQRALYELSEPRTV